MAKLFFRSASGATAFVDTGFNWAAFALGPLWALAKRQWLLFVLLCIGQVPPTVISMIAEQRRDAGVMALSAVLLVLYMIACGAYANRLYRYFLERQGYVFESAA
ncbi:MAG TPA: DUF2628 domain-containing protein [Noviherbaspirillum sp.]|nr:DUF2628 domain-containing protein [Noviherbaspirillum sp.]